MNDEAYRKKLESIKSILEQFEEEDVDPDDADRLLEDGLESVSTARELLDVGTGTVMRVKDVNGEIRKERMDIEEKK